MTEFEFQISLAFNSSRSHTGLGADGHERQQACGRSTSRATRCGTVDRFGDVWDASVTPAADLVARNSRTANQATADGSLAHHSSVDLAISPDGAISVTNRPAGTRTSSAE